MSERQRPGDGRHSARPHADTLYKIEQLRALRQQHKRGGRVRLSWIVACQMIGIDPKTVRRHDPELRKRWDDWEY